jgi:hypothetical protein
MTPNSISIHVGGKSRRVLPPLPTENVIQEFQQKLLFYRFVWRDMVATSNFRVPVLQFRPEMAAIAQVLGAALVSEPDLQRGVVGLLEDSDQQARVDSVSSLEGVVLRAVLAYCHQANHEKVFVREIATASTEINREEGEPLQINSETAGHVLKGLGLYTRRIGNAGRGLVLDKSTQSQVHGLAHAYDVLPQEPSCGYCQKFQIEESKEHVQEV